MRRSIHRALLLSGGLAACTPAGSAAPGVGADAAAAATSAATAPSSSVAPATSSAPTAGAASVWIGTYKSGAGDFYVPDGGEWAKYMWRGNDGGDGLGDGPLTLNLDGDGQRVSGFASGALGDALLSGIVSGSEITATVRRKDPSDHGLTGTLVATRAGTPGSAGEKIEGTMRLSFGDAHVLREASFALTRDQVR